MMIIQETNPNTIKNDHSGDKPKYYTISETYLFCSELKGVA